LENHKVLVLCRQGGIGKTSLAVKLMMASSIDPLASTLADTCIYANVLFCIATKNSYDLAVEFLKAFGLAANRDGGMQRECMARLNNQRNQKISTICGLNWNGCISSGN
jgi:hypothetical protein